MRLICLLYEAKLSNNIYFIFSLNNLFETESEASLPIWRS